jgi:hypothetical protein
MEGEGSIWGLLLFLVVVGAFVGWKTGAFAKLRANIKDVVDANKKQ